jgi:hypothetical protein
MCASWRKSVLRNWNLPKTTYCLLLLLLCQCPSIYEDLCRRTLNFTYRCVSHESLLIKYVAVCATKYARNSSCLDCRVVVVKISLGVPELGIRNDGGGRGDFQCRSLGGWSNSWKGSTPPATTILLDCNL